MKSRIHARCLCAPSLVQQIEPTCKPAPRGDRMALDLNNRDRTPELGNVRSEGEGLERGDHTVAAEQGRVSRDTPGVVVMAVESRARDPATIGQPCLVVGVGVGV